MARVQKYISHGKKPLKVKPVPQDAPQPHTAWYHPKSGAIVIVLGTGRHTETGEFLVHYTYKGDFWSRPLSMWGDQVRHPKAKASFARFVQIKSTPPLFKRTV